MNERKEMIYVAPEMKVVIIEVEQCVMAASAESIGTWHEEQEW
jgi:hypothetical protein